jgi:hypothetical protein
MLTTYSEMDRGLSLQTRSVQPRWQLITLRGEVQRRESISPTVAAQVAHQRRILIPVIIRVKKKFTV